MNARTNTHQIINGADGRPAFVVIPYAEYIGSVTEPHADLIPHDVVSRTVDGATPMRAWREHLGLTQAQVAERMGVTQSGYQQMEDAAAPRKATRVKVAAALGLSPDQLDF
ncbi:MAG: transcriptional regulator [Candidatus Dactylopiibacterium carminicum]|uniref:Transcriptional regulator n=1 Tax=Candidatus Dactylopiibacterium carminicum TaxID=857335 RepID=A0A272EPF6_9RHOO|nr:helix-turn-helix transcriptional regulator [Candidatus Dactylopiibacterium carminicum]KAF7597971.1 XRE family transcriptional regulator [Candidatus Dactylopiibacterium carminicum]PAS91550.1 MAG: transcriptional regulator [Candidatus Dactylopiibacterium carminicum]PAS93217.1 MAG: transcriptional regulator [Candidatus Dactylopiibacterium carminicum]PAS96156.1 MAG: transcriptional regulator [Candidatus Dactylopiibacterium carminicum]